MNQLKPLLVRNILSSQWSKLVSKHKKPLVLLVVLIIGSFFWLTWSNSSVFNFVFGEGSSLKTEDKQVNVLLLGIAGKGHDGPNLTDTIMVVSYNTKNHNLSLISLPRDLWVDKHQTKVNSLYQIGINKGNGLGLVREEIGELLGIEIPYVVRVDFSGFVKAVDLVGGIDVEVEKSFDDYLHPVKGKQNDTCEYKEEVLEISQEMAGKLGVESGKLKVLLDPQGEIATAAAKPGVEIVYQENDIPKFFHCRFEHISFSKGNTHMDGELALKFVRSRHGTNNEGSDFARSKRQQLLLEAFKEKVFSVGILLDPPKIISLVKTFGDSIDTNITQNQYPAFIKVLKQVEGTQSFTIDANGEESLLINPPVGEYGAWILIPPNNDFSKIQKFVDDILSGKLEASPSAQQN